MSKEGITIKVEGNTLKQAIIREAAAQLGSPVMNIHNCTVDVIKGRRTSPDQDEPPVIASVTFIPEGMANISESDANEKVASGSTEVQLELPVEEEPVEETKEPEIIDEDDEVPFETNEADVKAKAKEEGDEDEFEVEEETEAVTDEEVDEVEEEAPKTKKRLSFSKLTK